MMQNRLQILFKALGVLLKVAFYIVIKLAFWSIVLGSVAHIVLNSDVMVSYMSDFTPTTRKLVSEITLIGLIFFIYICKLLIQIFKWIKCTAFSLINKTDKQLIKKFNIEDSVKIKLIVRRTIAYLIDIILVTLISCSLIFLFGVCYYVLTSSTAFWELVYRIYYEDKWTMASVYIVAWFISITYFVCFERSRKQATLGKKLLRLKVVDAKNKRILLKISMVRWLLYWMAGDLRLVLGTFVPSMYFLETNLSIFIWVGVWFAPIFFTEKHMTLYDILSKTRVVGRAKRKSVKS